MAVAGVVRRAERLEVERHHPRGVRAVDERLDAALAQLAHEALDRGLKLAVNPDAHSIDGLDDVGWGLAVARRAGATKDDLVNCVDIEEWMRR